MMQSTYAPCECLQGRSFSQALIKIDRVGEHAAAYTFAAPTAAKYISESIDAQVSFINQVPYDVLRE